LAETAVKMLPWEETVVIGSGWGEVVDVSVGFAA
jgi:hypothetical protein